MNRWIRSTALLAVLAIPATPIVHADEPTTKPVVTRLPADEPSVKTAKDGTPDKNFMRMHESFLKQAKAGNIDLLFLGDSITAGWINKKENKEVWDKNYGDLKAADFGIGGDRTEHVLWRMNNGELEGISPKVVVLMIGTNNTGGWSADEIATADTKIVKELHEKLPNSKVLLLGVFPRAAKPTDPLRAKIKSINEQIAKLDDGKTTRYLDIGDKFLDADGNLPKEIMPDALHPNAKGYEIWASAMKPLLDEMLKG